ncbi:Histone-lysine N-methyltransferase SETMAR, partial [Habropoda laboriosa]
LIVLHDNSRPHTASATLQKFVSTSLHKNGFRKQEDIENAFQQLLSRRDSDFYVRGINAPVIRWQKCIEHYGNYLK